MKRLLGFIGAIIGLLLVVSFAFTNVVVRQDYSLPRATVHQIYGYGNIEYSGGSGVMIAPTLMLTAAHVAVIEGLSVGPQHAPVRVLRIDKEKDIALLLVAIGCPCAHVATREPEIDAAALTIGWPINDQVEVQIATEGRIQGYAGNFMRATPAAAFGNSGGGIFVWDGVRWSLAGILSGLAGGRRGVFPHLTLSVRGNTLLEFLNTRSAVELDAVKPAVIGL